MSLLFVTLSMGGIQTVSRNLHFGGDSKESINIIPGNCTCHQEKKLFPQADRGSNGSSLEWKIWEGFMEELACELRVMDRVGGFPEAEMKAISIQGQKEKGCIPGRGNKSG